MNIDGVTAVIFCELGFAAAAGSRPVHPVPLRRDPCPCLGGDAAQPSHQGTDAQGNSIHLQRTAEPRRSIQIDSDEVASWNDRGSHERLRRQLARQASRGPRRRAHLRAVRTHQHRCAGRAGEQLRSSFINTRHEQIAAHAADGYARAKKRTGVVLSHLGPGLTNAATGVANAALDSVPMVVIAGRRAQSLLRQASASGSQPACGRIAVRDLSAVREARLASRSAGSVPGDHRQGLPSGGERPAGSGAGLRADGYLLRTDRCEAVRADPGERDVLPEAVDRRYDGAQDHHAADRARASRCCMLAAGSCWRMRRRNCATSSTIWAFQWRIR